MANDRFLEELIKLLPAGTTVEALLALDPSKIIANRIAIARKDVAQFSGLLPALMKRSRDLDIRIGFELGKAVESGNPVSGLAITLSQESKQLVEEAYAVFLDYADERPALFADSYKDERQNLRIFAKRNKLDAGYQKLLGVDTNPSSPTPTEFSKEFREKYLRISVV
jgi:hypothetical protein